MAFLLSLTKLVDLYKQFDWIRVSRIRNSIIAMQMLHVYLIHFYCEGLCLGVLVVVLTH